SSKLVVMGRSPTDLRQLEVIMEQATSRPRGPQRAPDPSQSAVPHDRARSRAQVEQISLAILGALLDFTELLDDPEVEEAISVLDGDAALAVAAMRHHFAPKAIIEPTASDPATNAMSNKGIYADEFLAQIPRPI